MRAVICIEGHDGAGKTTLANALEKMINDYTDVFCHRVKFPSEIPPKGADTEWFMEDFKRVLSSDKGLAIAEGLDNSVVIFDRSFVSTVAYQGITGDKYEAVEAMRIAFDGFMEFVTWTTADVMMVLHCEVDTLVAMKRLTRRIAQAGRPNDDTERVLWDEGVAALRERIEDLKHRFNRADEYVTAAACLAIDSDHIQCCLRDNGFLWTFCPMDDHPPELQSKWIMARLCCLSSDSFINKAQMKKVIKDFPE